MKISLMALVAGFCLVVALPLAATAGPTPGGPNSDTDGVEDAFDNCVLTDNDEQKDVDHDGCGDACDCDYSGDTLCTGVDFTIFANTYLKGVGDPGYDARVDSNCDGLITGIDFTNFANRYLTSVVTTGECP